MCFSLPVASSFKLFVAAVVIVIMCAVPSLLAVILAGIALPGCIALALLLLATHLATSVVVSE